MLFRSNLPAPNSKSNSWNITPPPAGLQVDPFYQKYIEVDGFPIVASQTVNDYAIKEAAHLVNLMLAQRTDVRRAMIQSGSRMCILAYNEFTTDLPEFARFQPKDFWDARARGTGGSATDPYCSCGEENLLGYDGDPTRACRCLPTRAQAYRQKLSGPLLDRIDIRLVVPRLSRSELLGEEPGEASAAMRSRVEIARDRQRRRWSDHAIECNAQLPGPLARREARVTDGAADLLAGAVDRLGLSGRGFDRTIKVARTIADLVGADEVGPDHVAEALTYRADPSEEVAAGVR